MSLKLAVSGATGRMGKAILELANADSQFSVVGSLGRGAALSSSKEKAQVLIDFSQPEGTMAYLKEAVSLGVGHVIGTTGFTDAQKKEINEASKKIPVVLSSNMSVGMNLLFALVGEAAATLGTAYDVEIIEAHHHFKKDAPSGSALSLGEAVAKAWKVNLNDVATHGREGNVGARKEGTIGFHAVRGGDIVGDHTVLYAGPGERLELKHVAHSRNAFAQGSLKAALFLAGKKNGLYDMRDVLGLRGSK